MPTPRTTPKRSILIVEDEVAMLKALQLKFQKERFRVLLAKNGVEGLDIAPREQPDIILLDILMPEMDGMTMLKKLRKLNEWGKRVPVIILTNVSESDELNKQVVDTEPSFYLVKSDWKLDDIASKVRERLGIASSK